MTGTAISLPITGIITGSEFIEPRVPYTYDVLLTLDVSEQRTFEVPIRSDGYSDLDPAPPSDFYDSSTAIDLQMIRPVYDEALIPMYKEEVAVQGEATTSLIVVLGGFSLVILAIVGIVSLWLRFREETILEAEIEPHPRMDS